YLSSRKKNENHIDPFRLNLNAFLGSEFQDLTDAFFNSFSKEKVFSRIVYGDINKLRVLNKALEFGIKIPQTYITTSSTDYKQFSKEGPLIVKPISNAPTIHSNKKKYLSYTAEVKNLDHLESESFAPSQFQRLIEKKYEIRAFLLKREFYSMAIFSQEDEQTKTDFRQYNDVKPNRNVPFKLPEELEEKLLKLADFFNLETGSFDLIKTKDNEYIFLEVNPEGQFGMVSYPCNYYLEKKMAEALIKTHKKNVNKKSN
ncbi:MAG: grasp-with-spasm system ATP-grasp peptide maturase, partial [Cyclobacteriaceae bacterium]